MNFKKVIQGRIKILCKVIVFLAFLKLYDYLFADKLSDYLGLTFHKQVDFDLSTIISAVIIAPLIEELIFRLPLTRDERLNWVIIIPVIIQILVLNSISTCLILIPLVITVAVIIYMLKKKIALSDFVAENLLVSSFVISIFFSWTHAFLLNDLGLSTIEILFITLVAYFPLSLLLAYTRIKHGILYAVLLHSLFNLATIIINPIVYG